MELCRYLRWKGFDERQSPDEVRAVAFRNTVPYTCLRTCQPWGVDDDIAGPENCVSGRACYNARGPIDESDESGASASGESASGESDESGASGESDESGESGESASGESGER